MRREEVARLADVGVSWYTWLEQGRNIHVSEPLLERLARALRLSPTERTHLFELAHGRPAARPATTPVAVSPTLQGVLDAYRYPALAYTTRWDILAWNKPVTFLYGDFALLPAESRNMLWGLFTSPEVRERMPGWEVDARRAVAGFRLEIARVADRTEFDSLASKLMQASPEFARMWSEHDVAEVPEGAKQIAHPDVGVIEFEHVTLTHAEPDGRELRVVYYVPRKGESELRAQRLFQQFTR